MKDILAFISGKYLKYNVFKNLIPKLIWVIAVWFSIKGKNVNIKNQLYIYIEANKVSYTFTLDSLW